MKYTSVTVAFVAARRLKGKSSVSDWFGAHLASVGIFIALCREVVPLRAVRGGPLVRLNVGSIATSVAAHMNIAAAARATRTGGVCS